MKKTLFRKLRGLCNDVLVEEKTNEIIEKTAEKTVNAFLKDIESKSKKRNGK